MKKFNIKKWQDQQKRLSEMMDKPCPSCGKHHSLDFGPNCPQYDGPEGEGIMAKGNAIELSHDAADVSLMIGPNTNLHECVESKITLAANYLNKVTDYLTHYEASREKLMEQEDDTFFKDVFGDENDDFELSAGYTKARDLIAKLRQQYRNMSDEDLDEFSKEMVAHFLDNIAAKEKAKMILNK